jgi:alkanesulfonate monooxygenase SsuD/methylene tetrahydromethanopterin reductase-like flavin-dependent oxidoreductase (luciferase family)
VPVATRGFAILRGGVADAAAVAAEAERRGYQTAWSPEFYTRSGIVTMAAAGTPQQVQAKLAEFGRHVDHVIVYPVSFGLTEERSRQVTAGLLAAAAP